MIKQIKKILILSIIASSSLFAQNDSTTIRTLKRISANDSTEVTNQDAMFARPFIGIGKSKTAVGGYFAFKEYKQATNTKPQIEINNTYL